MNQTEKRQLETLLIREGLARLGSGELIQQLAELINNWPGDRHDFLMASLNECDDKDRTDMYNAIRPHLAFKPLPLESYVARIAEKAGAAVSQHKMRVEGDTPKPIQVGKHTYVPVHKAFATQAVATVRCHRCPKVEKFVADTPTGAMIAARNAGWIREKGVNKECCPDCQSQIEDVALTALSAEMDKALTVLDKRRVQ